MNKRTAADIKDRKHGESKTELENRVRRLTLDLKTARVETRRVQSAYDSYREENEFLWETDTRAETVPVIEPALCSGEGEGLACWLTGDWHGLARVNPREVNGLNSFNYPSHESGKDCLRERVLTMARGFLRLIQIERAGIGIKKAVLALGGDTINNQLHRDAIETNAGTPQEEVRYVSIVIRRVIDFLLDEGGLDELWVLSVDGNHDRDTEKKQYWNRSRHSHEWLMMQNIRDYYEAKGEKRIKWFIAEGYFLKIPLAFGIDKQHDARVIRMHHGDAIRFQGGVGGLTVPTMNRINVWQSRWAADMDWFFHHHQTVPNNRFICTGTTMGYSPLSEGLKAGYEPPQSSFVLLDKRRWRTSFRPIFAE